MTGQPPWEIDKECLQRQAAAIVKALPLDEPAAEESVSKLVSELYARSGAAVGYLQEKRDAAVADNDRRELPELDAQLFVGRQWAELLTSLGTALRERERARFEAEEKEAARMNDLTNEVLNR